MFNRAKRVVSEQVCANSGFIGSIYRSYKKSRSERLARTVVRDYFEDWNFENEIVEIVHTESAKENCGGLECGAFKGRIVGKPFLSDSHKTLNVNLESTLKKKNIISLLVKDEIGWKSTGWEVINNASNRGLDG